MKHIILAFSFLFVCMANAYSQSLHIREIFKQMPDSLIPYLTENDKLDLIDFIDSNMKSEVENALNGKTILKTLTKKYLDIELTPASSMQMKLLPYTSAEIQSPDLIVCVVTTYGDDIKESKIKFYTTKWEEIFINNPLATETLCNIFADSMTTTSMQGSMPNVFVEAKLSPDEDELLVNLSYPTYGTDEKSKMVFRNMSTTLKWTGSLFKQN